MKAFATLAGLICLLLGSSAQAHIASNGFLVAEVSGENVKGSIELAVRDVELAIGVDRNNDGNITWGELRASAPQLRQYVAEHLHFAAQGRACTLSFEQLQVNDRVDGSYSWLPWTALCSAPIRQLSVSYALMQDIDPSHRGLLTLKAGSVVQTGVLGGPSALLNFDVSNPSRLRTFTQYLQAGIWHIWGGIDHLLFLLSLLLPAVLLRQNDHWRAMPSARPAFLSILKVVTAFTLAHSITLSLAAFDVVRLPSRLTESIIAASIIVAALNNLFPLITQARARIAFAFGLLHGFGFASVLADMGLPNGARLLSLVAFNLGIECGQLAVVLLVMPLVYSMRRATLYQRTVLPVGSAAIALLATVWLMQRALGP
ncbi:MAG: HupE/UreJ family protein [Steroidobacteraceae bacterium]